jgi:hypothetical protein
MVAFVTSLEGDIVRLRIRRGWLGRMVLQVEVQLISAMPRPSGQPPEVTGFTWRDACADDLKEVASVHALLPPEWKLRRPS